VEEPSIGHNPRGRSHVDELMGNRTTPASGRTDEGVEALFRRDYRTLVATLSVLSGRPEDAADAVQSAFVEVHRRWDEVSRLDEPVLWVRRVAINRLIDEQRKRTRRERLNRLLPPQPHVAPPEASEASEIVRAIGDLSIGQRVVVAMHYFDDLPIATIADLLGVAPGTVKSQLAAARARLAAAPELREH
jgi:RNA polymerase sigma factor (sigma-70 family)